MAKEEIIHRPECPDCNNPMIFSFCIAYKEYICIPCGRSAEFFHGLEKIETTQKKEDALKKKYESDLDRLAFTVGGANCGKCNSSAGNNCKNCTFPDEFLYWDKGGN